MIINCTVPILQHLKVTINESLLVGRRSRSVEIRQRRRSRSRSKSPRRRRRSRSSSRNRSRRWNNFKKLWHKFRMFMIYSLSSSILKYKGLLCYTLFEFGYNCILPLPHGIYDMPFYRPESCIVLFAEECIINNTWFNCNCMSHHHGICTGVEEEFICLIWNQTFVNLDV